MRTVSVIYVSKSKSSILFYFFSQQTNNTVKQQRTFNSPNKDYEAVSAEVGTFIMKKQVFHGGTNKKKS